MILNETGLPIDDAKSRVWIESNKPHLLPPKFEQSLADRAFAENNLTARGALVRESRHAGSGSHRAIVWASQRR